MEATNGEILDFETSQFQPGRRRKLLPVWIKIFTWMFMIFGGIVPVSIIFALLGYEFNMSLYGLSTNSPLSVFGLIIITLFLLKGITAFGLWFEKTWAPDLAQADAVTGIIICGVLTFISPATFTEENLTGIRWSFRFELLFLIPYLMKMGKIKPAWKSIK